MAVAESQRVTLDMVAPIRPLQHDEDYTLWYILNDSDTVVVFIHGIFSNARTCSWSCDPRVFWPDLVAACDESVGLTR